MRLVVVACFVVFASCGPGASKAADAKYVSGITFAEPSEEDSRGIFGVAANGDTLVVAQRHGALVVFDTRGTFPRGEPPGQWAAGTANFDDSRGFGAMTMSGTDVFVVSAAGVLSIFDVSTPSAPTLRTRMGTGLQGAVRAVLVGDRLIITNLIRVAVIDVGTMSVLSTKTLPQHQSIAATATHLFAVSVDEKFFNVFPIDATGRLGAPSPNIAVTQAGEVQLISALGLRNGQLYAAGPQMLASFDLTDPMLPVQRNPSPGVSQHSANWPFGTLMQSMAFLSDSFAIAPGLPVALHDVSKTPPERVTLQWGGSSSSTEVGDIGRADFMTVGAQHAFVGTLQHVYVFKLP